MSGACQNTTFVAMGDQVGLYTSKFYSLGANTDPTWEQPKELATTVSIWPPQK